MTIRLGIIGLSPGNGHPYSWAAICNGYDNLHMEKSGFPSIPEYLRKQSWPDAQLNGVQVTHVWTQNEIESHKIAKASLVKTVVQHPEDMIGEIDALLLARDDAQNHRRYAEPFLKEGLPVYIDKPIALSVKEFNELHSLQQQPGQIFSCSALRFAKELELTADEKQRLGKLRFIQGFTPKYWETYSIHLIDPLLAMLGHDALPELLFCGPVSDRGRLLALRWPHGGPDVHLMAGGDIPSPIQFRVVGELGETILTFTDSFTAFKNALAEFVSGVHEGCSRLPEAFNRRAVQIIQMGL